MILAKHGLMAAATIRRTVPQVSRVLLARTDGIALYDDAALAERDAGAAVTATAAGLAATVATVLTGGEVDASITLTSEGIVAIYPIDAGHLLAVIAPPSVDLGLLDGAVGAAIAPLGGRWRVAEASA